MRALPLVTALLSPVLEERQNYNDGQYTQVVQATIWTSTPTYVVSYISTQIVTLTSYVPCPVTTSYTTVYQCSSCGACQSCGIGATACLPKICATQINDVVQPTTEPYNTGEYAVAYVTNNNGQSYTTTLAAFQCTAYAQVNLANYNCATLPACTNGPPPPGTSLTCEAKPCTTLGYLNGNSYVTLTEGTQYAFTEYAYLTANNILTSTPASLCAALTTPAQWAVSPVVACGNDNNGIITYDSSTYCTGGGGQVLTYTYTTQGSTIVVATTLPCRGGPFHLTGDGGGRGFEGGKGGRVLFYGWMVVALGAGVGMVML